MVDEVDYVNKWRKESGTQSNAVYFKLFSAPQVNSAVVSIRGSETMFDWLANLHLWFASGVAQIVKWLTPFGWSESPMSCFEFTLLLVGVYLTMHMTS